MSPHRTFAVELDAQRKHRWDGRETAGLHDRRNPRHVADVEGIGLWCGCRLGRGAGGRRIRWRHRHDVTYLERPAYFFHQHRAQSQRLDEIDGGIKGACPPGSAARAAQTPQPVRSTAFHATSQLPMNNRRSPPSQFNVVDVCWKPTGKKRATG